MFSPEQTPILSDRVVTIAVDMQRDFMYGGPLEVPHAERAITPLNKVMRYTRDNDGIVVATRDWHPLHTPHFDEWPVHCVRNTSGAEFHPKLDLRRTDVIVSKGTGQTDGYSGFEGESDRRERLERIIRPNHRGERVTVLIGGVATEYCVLNTVRDSLKLAKKARHFGDGIIQTVLISDAIAGVESRRGDSKRAIKEMLRSKAIARTSQEILSGGVRIEG